MLVVILIWTIRFDLGVTKLVAWLQDNNLESQFGPIEMLFFAIVVFPSNQSEYMRLICFNTKKMWKTKFFVDRKTQILLPGILNDMSYLI